MCGDTERFIQMQTRVNSPTSSGSNHSRQAAGLGKTRASHGSPSTAGYSDVTPTQAGSSLSTDLTETAGQSGGPALVVGFDEKWLIQVEQADVVCQSRSH